MSLDVFGRFRPFVLHHHQDAEAELGHDLGRVGAHRRRVKAALRMRDRPRPHRGARYAEELAVMLEAVARQRLDDDVGGLDKARPCLAHRHPEPLVFDAGRTPPKAEQTPPAAQYIEQRDLLRDPDGIVPRQDDDRGTELDTAGAAGVIRQQLARRRRHRIAGEMVFEREQGIEPERFGEVAHRQVAPDHGRIGPAGLAQHIQRDPDLHGTLRKTIRRNDPPTSLPRQPAHRCGAVQTSVEERRTGARVA